MKPKMERALAALLSCPTRAEAAKAAGLDPKTLWRYSQDPEFQQAYRNAVSNLLNDATRQAQQSLNPALSTLRNIVEDREQPASSRIQAARSILEYGLRLTEQSDILSKLEALEQWKEKTNGCQY